ncbi:MAG: hypothetical protein ACTHK7_22000, partial [Aureliella sp.]
MQSAQKFLGIITAGTVLILGLGTQLSAQYPLLPPETNGNANYEWRPDLGGWLDRQSKLVWGYHVTSCANRPYTYSNAQNAASSYPAVLAAEVDRCLNDAAIYDAEVLKYQETDPARAQLSADWAQYYRDSADAFALAAEDASQFSNWRMPTLREFQTAWSRGLFSRGTLGFNMDMSPAPGYDQGYMQSNWTSDPLSKNKKTATWFSLFDGSSG